MCDDCWRRCPRCDQPNGMDLGSRGRGATRVCKECRNARLRERWARLNKGLGPGRGRPRSPGPHEFLLHKTCTGPCGERKPWAEFPPRAYHPDGSARVVASRCHRCEMVATMARRAADPVERAKQRVIQDAWQRRKRESLRAERNGAGPRLPLEPFRAWLKRAMQEHEEMSTLADLCGIPERTIRRAIDGSQAHVSRRVADQCFTRTGYHLDDFYGQEAA